MMLDTHQRSTESHRQQCDYDVFALTDVVKREIPQL